jgi:hypothetical protein
MPINPTWSLHSQKYIALGHKHLTWVIRSRVELFELPNVTFLMELKEKNWALHLFWGTPINPTWSLQQKNILRWGINITPE